MRCSYSTLVKAKRAGRATSVRVAPTGTAVEQYQVPLGNRHSLKEAGVIGLPSWSDTQIQTETWARVPRLAATCPRRVVAFDGGKGNIDKTMVFGDEFDGTAINTSKWASYSGVTVSGGKAILDQNETLASAVTKTRPIIIHAILESNGTVNWATGVAFGDGVPLASNAAAYFVGAFNGTFYLIHNNGSSYVLTQAIGVTQTINTQYHVEMALTTTHVIVYVWAVGSARPVTPTYSYANSAIDGKAIRFGHTGASMIERVDRVYVRKYVTNEPLTGTVAPTATNRALSRSMSHADLIRSCCT